MREEFVYRNLSKKKSKKSEETLFLAFVKNTFQFRQHIVPIDWIPRKPCFQINQQKANLGGKLAKVPFSRVAPPAHQGKVGVGRRGKLGHKLRQAALLTLLHTGIHSM